MTEVEQEKAALRKRLRGLAYALRILEYDRRRIREATKLLTPDQSTPAE